MATINPDIEAAVEYNLKANVQPPVSLRQARVKERNIISVKAKKDQPSLLTRDERFQEFMVRPYAVIPRDHKEAKAISQMDWNQSRMVGITN